jgi:predicted neuraminidase
MIDSLRGLCTIVLVMATFAASRAESELLFPPQREHVHSSSVVECPGGDLLVVWYQGSGERTADDVRLNGARLRRGADAWGPAFPMADTPHLPDCNPVLFVDAKNRLWMFWIAVQASRWERSVLKYRRAESFEGEGAPEWSWQDVILLTPGEDFQAALRDGFESLTLPDEGWAEYAQPYSRLLVEAAGDAGKRETGWMPRARPLQLANGRIVLPLYSDGFNVGLMAISDDHGETWQASQPLVGVGPIQPTLAQRSNGDIVAYCRDSGGPPPRVLESVSRDEGMTWSLAVDTELPNSGSGVALTVLADHRWVMIYNDTESGRHRLAAALSDDEGHSWKHQRYLERDDSERGRFGYPTAIQSRDGQIHVTYSYEVEGGEAIKHASFSPEWILEDE